MFLTNCTGIRLTRRRGETRDCGGSGEEHFYDLSMTLQQRGGGRIPGTLAIGNDNTRAMSVDYERSVSSSWIGKTLIFLASSAAKYPFLRTKLPVTKVTPLAVYWQPEQHSFSPSSSTPFSFLTLPHCPVHQFTTTVGAHTDPRSRFDFECNKKKKKKDSTYFFYYSLIDLFVSLDPSIERSIVPKLPIANEILFQEYMDHVTIDSRGRIGIGIDTFPGDCTRRRRGEDARPVFPTKGWQ